MTLPAESATKESALAPYFILYRRVSTGKQAAKDLSLPAQRREQMEVVRRQNGIVLGDFEDGGLTGKNDRRAGFQDALTLAHAPQTAQLVADGHAVYLLVWKGNRAFRNRRLAINTKADLKERGIRVLSVTEAFVGGEATGDIIMEGLQELIDEVKLIEVRIDTARGLRQMRDPRDPATGEATGQGRQSGQIPFGYAFRDRAVQGAGWIADPEAAPFVRRLFEGYADGKTLAELTREMNATGLRTPTQRTGKNIQVAGHWLGTSLREILTNRVYVGEVKHTEIVGGRVVDGRTVGGRRVVTYYPGAHPPLVTRDLFERVQMLMARRTKGRGEASRGLFSGLLRCPRCGARLYSRSLKQHGITGERGGSPRRTYYHCGAHAQTVRARIYGAEADKDYEQQCLGFRLSERRAVSLLLTALDRMEALLPRSRRGVSLPDLPLWPAPVPADDPAARRAALVHDRERLEATRARFQWQHGEGLMEDDALRANLARIAEQQSALDRALAALTDTPPPPPALTLAQIADLRHALTDSSLTPVQRRDRLRQAFESLTPSEDKTHLTIRLSQHLTAGQ